MYQHTTIVIKALEDGVIVLFSSADNSENTPPERLDCGEVLVLPMPERHPAIRIRGRAEIYTPEHVVEAESSLVIGGRSQ